MHFLNERTIIGVFLLLLAVILLLNNLGIGIDINVGNIWDWWPVIPLIIGLNWLVLSFRLGGSDAERRAGFSWGQLGSGLLLVAVGAIYLGRNLNLFEVDMSRFWNIFWPAILIFVAISLIRGPVVAGRGNSAFLGGIKRGGKSPWKLESGSYFAFMGGVDLDLTSAEIPTGETLLDISAIMGGVDVVIPAGLAVVYEGTVILGEVSLAGQEDGGILAGRRMVHNVQEHNERLLRITGRVIMGGVEIKER